VPILQAEQELFPEDLLSEPPGAPYYWRVAHTKPRQEKALAREILPRGIAYYLPCQSQRVRVRGKIVLSYSPLFSGYLFLNLRDDQRNTLYATNRVAMLLPVTNPERLVADLRRVQHLLAFGEPIAVEHRVQPGERVLVRDGPLRGMEGIVLRVANGFKFYVEIEMLQQSVSVQIDGSMLGIATVS